MPSTVIQHEFETGDTIWVIRSWYDLARKPCDACKGQKVIRLSALGEKRQRQRKCPYCHAAGAVPDGQQQRWGVAGPVKITKVSVEREVKIDEKTGARTVETKVWYSGRDAKGEGYPFHGRRADEVFATRAKAEAEAKKRNAERSAPLVEAA
jgi:hypothetical protein